MSRNVCVCCDERASLQDASGEWWCRTCTEEIALLTNSEVATDIAKETVRASVAAEEEE